MSGMHMDEVSNDENSTADDAELLSNIVTQVKRRLNNSEHIFFGDTFQKERTEVLELIKRSVQSGESNTAIICGPPSSGKTLLVKSVLRDLRADEIINNQNAIVIWLNGLMHTDDRLTLLDIARQLKIQDFSEQTVTSKSFQENIIHLITELQKNQTQKPCVIFILDEFHLFTEHKNQLLLYNLFDIAQSAKSPICVLGMTYYSDVMDLLEKRVLSRFSHRLYYLAKMVTVEDRLAFLQYAFTLSAGAVEGVDEIYTYVWNSRVEEIVQSLAVRRALEQSLQADPGEQHFRNLLFRLINTVTCKDPLITVENIVETFAPQDICILLMSKLSALEVALIVAIKHHTVNYEREPFNFEMILAQYLKFVKQHASTMIAERAVVLKAFQRLQELELVLPVKKCIGNVMGKIPLDYQLYTFNLTEDQVTEAVKLNKGLSADLIQWAENVQAV